VNYLHLHIILSPFHRYCITTRHSCFSRYSAPTNTLQRVSKVWNTHSGNTLEMHGMLRFWFMHKLLHERQARYQPQIHTIWQRRNQWVGIDYVCAIFWTGVWVMSFENFHSHAGSVHKRCLTVWFLQVKQLLPLSIKFTICSCNGVYRNLRVHFGFQEPAMTFPNEFFQNVLVNPYRRFRSFKIHIYQMWFSARVTSEFRPHVV